eukprot:CAMPEP_0194277530 /NCGR_PEP_ID=MMETSP0169-20130528/9846_1 /TAXON_ID=218684 /ORGANISM="Corethron pennatum, Strain L29A3" /LENGTH=181 /DNA_ID=CAMNT_0039021537 /DNA_START=1 /DNA_END=544 /DNA_ORIENTATION=+
MAHAVGGDARAARGGAAGAGSAGFWRVPVRGAGRGGPAAAGEPRRGGGRERLRVEKDVACILAHCRGTIEGGVRNDRCQTLMFSATMTSSLAEVEQLGRGDGTGMELVRIDVGQDFVPEAAIGAEDGDGGEDVDADADAPPKKRPKATLPAGLVQQYLFMPSAVRDAHLVATLRTFLHDGG